MKKFFLAAMIVMIAACSTAFGATKYDAELERWTRSEQAQDDMGGRFTLKATPYTAEYINTLMEAEAERNMWTASELEDYKYNFLRTIRIDEYFAVHLEMENLGASAHMAPFDEMCYMWIGNKKYKAVEYEPRFNMPLQGTIDGLVFFPRYDEKTGKPIINKDMSVRFVLIGAASPALNNRDLRITWDIKADSGMITGSAADRMEVDRLLRRIEKLNGERDQLEEELEAKKREIKEILDRVNELQGRN